METVHLPAEPDIGIDRSVPLLRSHYADHPDNDAFLDFSCWPPARLPLPGFAEDAGFARRWRQLHRDGDRNIWTCREPKGKIDIALFWNAVTDETFVIGQGDIKLDQPTVIYQRGLGRYLAVRGEAVALLREFDAMYEGSEKVVLRWETA